MVTVRHWLYNDDDDGDDDDDVNGNVHGSGIMNLRMRMVKGM